MVTILLGFFIMTSNSFLLHQYIIDENIHDAYKLINEGNVDVNAINEQNWSPLHLCAQTDQLKIAKFLIAANAKIQIKNNKGVTPLHTAVWADAKKMTNFLLSQGANPNAKDLAGWAPLSLAAWNNNVELIRELVSSGASVNTRFKDGSTALHYAVWNNSVAAVEELIENGAMLNSKNKEGITAYELAVKLELDDVMEFFETIKNGVKNQRDTAAIKNIVIEDVPEITEENYINTAAAPNAAPNIIQEAETTLKVENPQPALSISAAEKMLTNEHVEQPNELASLSFRMNFDKNLFRESADGGESVKHEPSQLINFTLSGDKVRRKSEVIIANLLYSLDIDYIYERKICGTVNRGVLYPSFTIFSQNDDLIIWEHLSFSSDNNLNEQKDILTQWYQENGFNLNVNLFFTSDSDNGGIDSRQLIQIAEKIIEITEGGEENQIETA